MKKNLITLFIVMQCIGIAHAQSLRDKLLSKYVFDVDVYLLRNPDVAQHFKGDKQAATEHWISTGFYEYRRAGIVFNLPNYIAYNLDIARAFGPFQEAYLDHFLNYGIAEGRTSSFFYSGKYYGQVNRDVATALQGNYRGYIDHYLQNGIAEGRQASPYFSVREYMRVNPDIARAFAGNYEGALDHYTGYGRLEGRSLGSVSPVPSAVGVSGGTQYSRTFSGYWRSTQLAGYRFAVTQETDTPRIVLCQTPSSCIIGGASGNLDFMRRVTLIGPITSSGPQVQITVQFNSMTSASARLDSCVQTSASIGCIAGATGSTFDLIKE